MSPKQKALVYTASYVVGCMTIGAAVAVMDYFLGTIVTASIVGAGLIAYLSHMVYTFKLREYNYEEK